MTKAKKEEQAEFELDEEGKKKLEETAVDEIAEDAPEKDGEGEAEKKIKELQEKIRETEELRKSEREAERQRIAKLQKERDEATAKANGSENNAIVAKERELEAAKAAADAQVSAYEDLYEKALESGDSKQMREVNTKLQKAIVKQSQIEDAQEQFTNWKTQQAERAEQAKNQPKAPEMGQATKDWIARNPKFETDEDFRDEAIAAHHVALARGYAPDSKAYFQFIDKRLEKAFPAEAEDEEEAPAPKKEPVYSAPPSRGAGGGSGGGEKKVYKLTAQEREIAAACGMTDLEYAKEKEKIAKGTR